MTTLNHRLRLIFWLSVSMVLSNWIHLSRRAYCIVSMALVTDLCNWIVFQRTLLFIVILTDALRLKIRGVCWKLICKSPIQSIAEIPSNISHETTKRKPQSPDKRELRIAINANRHTHSNGETRSGWKNQITLATRQHFIFALQRALASWSAVD